MVNIKNATPANPPECGYSFDSANFSGRVQPGPNGQPTARAGFQPVAPDGKVFQLPRQEAMTDDESAAFQVALAAAARTYNAAVAAAQLALDNAVGAAYMPFLKRTLGFTKA